MAGECQSDINSICFLSTSSCSLSIYVTLSAKTSLILEGHILYKIKFRVLPIYLLLLLMSFLCALLINVPVKSSVSYATGPAMLHAGKGSPDKVKVSISVNKT